MKKFIKQVALLIFISSVFFTRCKKDDNSSSTSPDVLNSNVQQGKWKITLFNDSGNDETNHFSGYEFQFNAGGIATAVNGGSTVNGTWVSGTDDSQLKLYLDFGITANFDELNDDWHVTEQSSSIIKLEDVSGGGGGTDLLTFEKI